MNAPAIPIGWDCIESDAPEAAPKHKVLCIEDQGDGRFVGTVVAEERVRWIADSLAASYNRDPRLADATHRYTVW